tara:strand:+ start:5463 stop:6182 length:720 start_codon:yes stop_codon:yes gene_type:complete
MADENEYDVYDDLDVEGATPTQEEYEDVFGDESYGHLALRTPENYADWVERSPYAAKKDLEARREAARRASGLSGDRVFDYAERLKDIGEGRRKTEGQIEAEKQLDILAKGQRGRALGMGGFDAAELLQRAGRSAQQTELGGESAIGAAAKQARSAARDQLEQLLIAGEQRAEDRAFNMQQLAFQEEQASGSLWSNVLGGILGAVGAVVGAVATGGAGGAVVGGMIGSSAGKGAGRYLG